MENVQFENFVCDVYAYKIIMYNTRLDQFGGSGGGVSSSLAIQWQWQYCNNVYTPQL